MAVVIPVDRNNVRGTREAAGCKDMDMNMNDKAELRGGCYDSN